MGHPWNRDIPIWDVPKYILIWGHPKTGMSRSLLLMKDVPTNIPSIYWDIPVSQINILWDIPILMRMSSGTSLLYRFFICFNSMRIQLRMLCFRVTWSSHTQPKHTILHCTHNCMYFSTAHTRSWLIARQNHEGVQNHVVLVFRVIRLVDGAVKDGIKPFLPLVVRSEVACGQA